MGRRRVCLVFLLMSVGCAAPPPPVAPPTAVPTPAPPTSSPYKGPVVIEAAEQYFYPEVVSVSPGTTVLWKDVQGTHDMVAEDRSFASAVLFEGVNNVLKLLGDQYLARLYRLAAERFHLSEWDASILRKLQTLESIYQKISDQVASWRMELLEWIVIVLILIEILLPLLSRRLH